MQWPFQKIWNNIQLEAIIEELASGSRIDISNELWSKSVIFGLMEKEKKLVKRQICNH